MRIILASASPRRKALLESLGLSLTIVLPDVEEHPAPSESPRDYVLRLAKDKAQYVARHHEGTWDRLVAADTIVVLGEEILEKPDNEAHAKVMLQKLSGRAHSVWTGVCVLTQTAQTPLAFVVESRVHFGRLPDAQIDAYISTGEPFGKAGSYAIQGGAAGFVERIEGSYTNIVGLPLYETAKALGIMD